MKVDRDLEAEAENTEEAGPSVNEMRAFAYRLLGRREYAIRELRQRLRKKWPDAVGVECLVDQLADENLVSDQRFAESFLRSRTQRHQGPRKIRAEMRARGLDDSLISMALDGYAGSWQDLAGQWLERQQPGELDFRARQKYYRRLVNRGFSHDQAMDAVNART